MVYYLHSPETDHPIAMLRDRDGNSTFSINEVYSYTRDHLGSVRELVDYQQKVVQRYRYSAYGKTTVEKSDSSADHKLVENLFAYTGREYDQDTELYGYRNRYYYPELGRFISMDPIGLNGGDLNLYRYVVNNPIRFSDPNGLDRRKCSRNLQNVPFQSGKLRHDYLEFKDSKGNTYTTSWGSSGMIDETKIASSSRVCGKWKTSSDKADSLTRQFAQTINDLVEYNLTNYNCQNFSNDVMNFQNGK